MKNAINKKLPILALLAAAAFTFSYPIQGAISAPIAVAAQAPATEEDVLKAYAAASAQAESDLKGVEDRYLYALRVDELRTDADYGASTTNSKEANDRAENTFNESYRTDYWKAEDIARIAVDAAKAVQEAANSQARDLELATNKQAWAAFIASVKQANDAFAAQVNGGDPNSDALKPARQTLKVALKQFAKTYADALANAHATCESAVSAAAQAFDVAEKQSWKVREVARRPVEETRDYMEAQFKESFDNASKPALDAKNEAKAKAHERFMKEMTPLYKAHDAARLKRLDVWQRYQAGSISADTAVSELSQLVHS